ncbi:MAG: hypothetical protein KGJ10_05320 [Acidobacteriota bacterium]|nr:hypothetical protein [Acidobacteriota bacterium]MDE3107563.1 hypothetical protein [Acidobacteriota bacterium]
MSSRPDREWRVRESLENAEGNRCVDLFERSDGTFGFEEFRRDPEDRGVWTPLTYYSTRTYANLAEARRGASDAVGWLAPHQSGDAL